MAQCNKALSNEDFYQINIFLIANQNTATVVGGVNIANSEYTLLVYNCQQLCFLQFCSLPWAQMKRKPKKTDKRMTKTITKYVSIGKNHEFSALNVSHVHTRWPKQQWHT